jgi:alkylhydroperoxidase family enzyme
MEARLDYKRISPDGYKAVYQELSRHFSEVERVNLTYAITTINAWNRIAIGFRLVPGSYHPAAAG